MTVSIFFPFSMVKHINKINTEGFKLCKLQTNAATIAVTVKKILPQLRSWRVKKIMATRKDKDVAIKKQYAYMAF